MPLNSQPVSLRNASPTCLKPEQNQEAEHQAGPLGFKPVFLTVVRSTYCLKFSARPSLPPVLGSVKLPYTQRCSAGTGTPTTAPRVPPASSSGAPRWEAHTAVTQAYAREVTAAAAVKDSQARTYKPLHLAETCSW